MKIKCNLCGESFDSKELEIENNGKEIEILCPNACSVMIIDIDKMADIEILK